MLRNGQPSFDPKQRHWGFPVLSSRPERIFLDFLFYRHAPNVFFGGGIFCFIVTPRTYFFSQTLEERPSWEDNWCAAIRGRPVRNPNDHNRVQILSQIIPIYFNIMLSYRLVLRKNGLFSSALRTEVVCAFPSFHVSYMHPHLRPRLFHPFEFDMLNSVLQICWELCRVKSREGQTSLYKTGVCIK